MAKKAKLLWVDLEMTGLSPVYDRIMEVAAIATDFQLKEIARFQAVVKVNPKIIEKRMVGEFWEKNHESYQALVTQNQTGEPVRKVEQKLLEFLDTYFGSEIYLAGNSIHQDQKFLEREMPKVTKRLHYRMLDVSAWKIYFEKVKQKKFTKKEAHRALDDIEGSLEEFKYYLSFVK